MDREEILRKKAEAFDHYVAFERLKEEIIQLEKENELDIQNQQEEVQSEESIQLPTSEVENVQEEVIQDNSAVVTPIVESSETEETPQEEKQEETEEVNIGIGPQTLEQTPLIPAGVELQTSEETQPVQEPVEDKKVIIKTDTNAPKAIIVSTEQFQNSKKSSELAETLVLGSGENAEMTEPVIELPTSEVEVTPISPVLEVPTGEAVPMAATNPVVGISEVNQPAVVTPIDSGNDLESMMQKQQEAYAAGDIKTAEAIGNELIKRREVG